MDNTQAALNYAKSYIKNSLPYKWSEPDGGYELDDFLRIQLVNAVGRIIDTFGEITRKDVVLLVEAWQMAGLADGYRQPLVARGSKGTGGS